MTLESRALSAANEHPNDLLRLRSECGQLLIREEVKRAYSRELEQSG